MDRRTRILFLLVIAAFAISACSPAATQPEPGLVPTLIVDPVFTRQAGNQPASEAEVPRVSLEAARAALDSGTAVIVDVRSTEAYEASHVAGAVSIPLGEVEANPNGLALNKEQWIITYCT